jgi:galactose mutarotase-like enzyme
MIYIAMLKNSAMLTIENEYLTVRINPKGAELTSIFNKQTQLEYMWSADPDVWPRHSPVLFPIVGTLKDNTYQFDGTAYSLPRHGFAREKVFVAEDHQRDECVFALVSNHETRQAFPFDFRLRIKYSLLENTLSTTYQVLNSGDDSMWFSLGAHPAFNLPLVKGTNYDDYYLEFEKTENAGHWPISKEGLIERSPLPILENTHKLPLTKELFSKDALVFKSLRSSVVTLKSAVVANGIEFSFPGFPFLGLWAVKGGDFLCIEPWCGIADPVDTNQQLREKEGINKLAKGDEFARTWSARFF